MGTREIRNEAYIHRAFTQRCISATLNSRLTVSLAARPSETPPGLKQDTEGKDESQSN